MWAIEIVKAFPHGQLLVEIQVIAVGEELVELVLVGSVGPLDFSIELRRARLES